MARRRWFDSASRHGWLLGAGILLAGCSDGSEQPEPPGSLRGRLAVYVASYDDGRREIRRVLRVQASDDEVPLELGEGSEPRAGTELRVWGSEQNGVLHVERYQVIQAPDTPFGALSQPLIGATPNPTRSFAFVLIDVGGGVNLTADEARRRLFGMNAGDNSLRQYFLEASYRIQDISGDVFGPLRYPMATCDTRNLATTLRPQIPGQYDHYLWYFGSTVSACGWSGLAESGEPAEPANDTWYNARAGCTVLVQEPAHNFGMRHSAYLNCGSVPFADVPDGNCSHEEYGDPYCPMGRGCRHLNAWHKVYEGWLQGCNAVRVTSSGTFTLLPLESACDGAQVLQIPMARQRTFQRPADGGSSGGTSTLSYYYLELRTATGFDGTMSGVPTVLVRIGEGFRGPTQSGRHTWLLDMDRTTTRKDGLSAGRSYTDPAGGVRFTVESLSSSQATISVEMANETGPATCLDGTTFALPGPTSCGAGGSVGTGSGGTTGSGGSSGTGGSSAEGGSSGMDATGGTGAAGGVGGTGGLEATGGIGGSATAGSGGDAGSSSGSGGSTVGGTGNGGFAGTTAGGFGGNFGEPGCSVGSSCDACQGCYAQCRCQTATTDPNVCVEACTTSGAGDGGSENSDSPSGGRRGSAAAQEAGCACTTPRRGSSHGSIWLLALGALCVARRARS